MKKILALLVTVTLLATITMSSSVADAYSVNAYSGGGFQVKILINGSSIQGSVRVNLTPGDKATITLKLQKQNSNGGWTTVRTEALVFERSSYSTIDIPASSGKYRMSAIINVSDENGKSLESTTKYTGTITY